MTTPDYAPVTAPKPPRRVGLWMVGALGGVSSTVALGASALVQGQTTPVGLVTGLPLFEGIDLDPINTFVLGGHDIRRGSMLETVEELHARSNIFPGIEISACAEDLKIWTENIRPGVLIHAGPTVEAMADEGNVKAVSAPREAIAQIQADLRDFRARQGLDQVVVINLASTEPPFELSDEHRSLSQLESALDLASPPSLGDRAAPTRKEKRTLLTQGVPDPASDAQRYSALLPASGLYAYAALDLGWPYINFTPSLGASIPALEELARERQAPVAGQDGKTGETLIKTVLAPMFQARNLRVLSWVGHNIFGNRDGLVLNDPKNKESKVKSKDKVLAEMLGYRPQSHVSIEYIESLDDWKTAWDHIHFEGFLGTKMVLQFTWQGCDSILAAPLVLDLARLSLLAARRGERGVLKHLASFFKSPMGGISQDFHQQFALLQRYVEQIREE